MLVSRRNAYACTDPSVSSSLVCSFADALYIQIDKPYGDVEDEFVWAQTWYGEANWA